MSKLNNLIDAKDYYTDPFLSRIIHFDGYYEEECGDYTDVRGRGQGCGYNIRISFRKKIETTFLQYEDLNGQGVSRDVIIDDFCEESLSVKLYNDEIDNPYYHHMDIGY